MKIEPTVLNEILERVNLLELMQPSLPSLVKRGHRQFALCPFHAEKTPSFLIDSDQGYFHCFGCQAHGNAFDWLMRNENCSFLQAVSLLADQVGIMLPQTPSDRKVQEDKGQLMALLQKQTQVYRESLAKHAKGSAYLASRGFSSEIGNQFSLGFSGREIAYTWISQKEKALLRQYPSVFTISFEKQLPDSLCERLIFPIKDEFGNVVGFGGRTLPESHSSVKYINSKENLLFKKRDLLYGLFESKALKLRHCFVVEGYFDVLRLVGECHTPAVAPLGTAISEAQVATIFSRFDHICLCFDGDSAGQKATRRFIEFSLPLLKENKKVTVLALSEDEDPDTFFKGKSSEEAATLLEKSPSIFLFLLQQWERRYILEVVEDRAAYLREFSAILHKIKDPNLRASFAALGGAGVASLRHAIKRTGGNPEAAEVSYDPLFIETVSFLVQEEVEPDKFGRWLEQLEVFNDKPNQIVKKLLAIRLSSYSKKGASALEFLRGIFSTPFPLKEIKPSLRHEGLFEKVMERWEKKSYLNAAKAFLQDRQREMMSLSDKQRYWELLKKGKNNSDL